ncbi:MAG: hypothetical protein P9L94_19845 [Candidatus Hinthialibacter antarcticus]|nr:hypothetical protein [Candidatus Hinthialibacter antarcticus]
MSEFLGMIVVLVVVLVIVVASIYSSESDNTPRITSEKTKDNETDSVEKHSYDNTQNKNYELNNTSELPSYPVISIILFVLSAASLIGGFILAMTFWPGDPGFGMEWKITAYTPSIIWITSGIIEAVIFAALGHALNYLHKIAEHTSRLANIKAMNSGSVGRALSTHREQCDSSKGESKMPHSDL